MIACEKNPQITPIAQIFNLRHLRNLRIKSVNLKSRDEIVAGFADAANHLR